MARISAIDPRRTALLTIDLQNDFLHPEGAYGRAGQSSEAIAALPARIRPLADRLRKAGGHYISAQFTLVPGRDGEPLISAHLKELRPLPRQGRLSAGRLRAQSCRDPRARRFHHREGRLQRVLPDPP